jgi:NAD-dependent SIR2 family protein deacetylase
MKTRYKVLLILLALAAAIIFLISKARQSGFREGYAPIQPVKFSHKIHAGDNKMQCLYCHFAADKGRHAGIPPTSLCLNCHTKVKATSPEILKVKEAVSSQKNIKWIRVHNLPDFAYFNHAQHVNVGKVSCQTCHDKVETMEVLKQAKPMNMGWCIECHRENKLAPPTDHKRAAGGDCARCHY